MPPITPQSQRTGLITAVVVFAILFVVATIFAFYYGLEAGRAREELTQQRSAAATVTPGGEMTGREITQLQALARQEPPPPGVTPNMPALTIALTQRDQLARLIDPSAAPGNAQQRAQELLAGAQQQVADAGVQVSTQNMADAITSLTRGVNTKQQELEQVRGQLQQNQAALQQKTDELTQASERLEEISRQVRGEAQAAIAGATEYRSGVQQNVLGQIEKTREQERQAAQEEISRLNIEVASRQRRAEQLQTDIQTLQQRLGGMRVDPSEAVTRNPDGQIVRLGSNDTVYIGIGQGSGLVPGMTFEVYDRATGIPPVAQLGPDAEQDNKVAGKASIEVVRVNPNSAEARVINRRRGASPIAEGDYVHNLVFDPNTQFRFFVFGRFDLDRNGVATVQDTEVVRQLIQQWGGGLADAINVNTDFVVVGAEPEVPNLSAEEEQDPILVQRRAQAQQDLDAYLDVIAQARELNVPILNQNRFLYFVGYYDQARR